MDVAELERTIRLNKIFMPHAMRQREETSSRQTNKLTGEAPKAFRFAHYTTAEAALNIMRTKRLWMRNTTCMADYREVQHGFDILKSFFDPTKTAEFAAALDACVPGAAMEAITKFNGWWEQHLPFSIFVASMSEHSEKENVHGRLSMWRAFGASSTRVAIIIEIPRYTDSAQALGLMFSPVAYLTKDQVHELIREVISNASNECLFLQSLDRTLVVNYIFYMLLAGVACLKHEGFQEEQEWRAIYAPQINASPLMQVGVESVSGVPQHVYKIPLDRTVSPAIAELDISQLLHHVIIGPSPYPWVVYQAFVDELAKAGIANAAGKVFISDIPIRPGY